MKTQILRFTSLIIILSLLLSGGLGIAFAQGAVDPNPDGPLMDDRLDRHPDANEDILQRIERRRPDGVSPSSGSLPLEQSAPSSAEDTGGPDYFGYTWDDNVAVDWIDASSSIDTGMSGDSMNQAVGPINLPFEFSFYEEKYDQVWIAASGFLSFMSAIYWPYQQHPFPNPASPNAVIAPFWTVMNLKNSGPAGRVYYQSGGVYPNRYFVVEWYDVAGGTVNDSSGGNESYRFEVVLYENGDILFQYQNMVFVGERFFASIGIEDQDGVGLGYMDFDNYWSRLPSSDDAIRFYRPTPAPRVNIKPAYFGALGSPGGGAEMRIPIRNIGDLGTDTFEVSTSSSWPVALYESDGVTLLSDSDGDALVDTGPVAEGEKVEIVAKMVPPGGAVVGDANSGTLTAKSSYNPSVSKTVTLQAVVPTSFAQVFMDYYSGAHSLYLIQTGGRAIRPQTEANHYGADTSVAEAPNGNFIVAWDRERCLSMACSVYVSEIEYAVTNKYGEAVRPKTRLTDHSQATQDTYDVDPTVAVAGDGKIGVLWRRYLYRFQTDHWERNMNVYFAILNPDGTIATAPTKVTANSAWTVSTLDAPDFYNPVIAATSSSFVLGWMRDQQVSACTQNDCWLDDIYTTVYNTSGSQVRSVVNHTNDTTGSNWEGYNSPNLAALSNNRVMLLWTRDSDSDNYFMVLDAAGSTIKGATNLVGDGLDHTDLLADAAQLSDGKIAVAWTTFDDGAYHTRFVILNSSYNRTAGPTTLNSTAASKGEYGVSVAADQSGRAVFTSLDDEGKDRIFYALVNSLGNVITSPVVMYSSGFTYPDSGEIDLGKFPGYANTTYKSSFPGGVDGVLLMPAIPYGVLPGNNASLLVDYTNHGLATGTGVSLTLTLPAELTYLGDTSGIVPVPGLGTLTWFLPDLSFSAENSFTLNLGLPSGDPVGTSYPLHFVLSVTGETNPANNVYDGTVVVSTRVYLPMTMR